MFGHLSSVFSCRKSVWPCPICEMRPSCDEKTAYPLPIHLWLTLLKIVRMFVIIKLQEGSNNQCPPLFGHNSHMWPYYYLLMIHVWCTYDTLVTNLRTTSGPLVAFLSYTCNQPVTHLWPYCYSLVAIHIRNSFENYRNFL